ncbi:hypothetical protein J4E91_010954 [Alternaria rosae]|nr:hypothetical protein J4E91_010954 [Alternaria rosae]
MSSSNTEERLRKLWQDKLRQEHAKMRLCDDLQHEAVTYNNKALHYRTEREFFHSVRNGMRRQEAQNQLEYWSEQAVGKHYDLGKQVEKLVIFTAARKKVQEQLGKRYQLLNHELDSTTSVRHYMDENMGGSSLFAYEEWRS